jgi:hypothetical protein
MGLLGKAIAINAHIGSVTSKGDVASKGDAASQGGVVSAATHAIQTFINDFHHTNPQFHSIVFRKSEASRSSEDIYDMIVCHGATVADLSGGNVLVLLPGALDRELFAHRLCHSAGLSILSQLSADSPALALETLNPYLR